jgi:hypothetical protein
METAEQYLTKLYAKINPNHVVEIGADTPMILAARAGVGIPRIAICDFKKANDFKRAWWETHREFGINVERLDGDARELSSLVKEADVVYAHNVLFTADENRDVQKSLAHRRGEVNLTPEEYESLLRGFMESECKAIEESLKVARNGHVVWFTQHEGREYFTKLANRSKRECFIDRVIACIGEDPDFILDLYHLYPPSRP